jgi:hypothetical protein
MITAPRNPFPGTQFLAPPAVNEDGPRLRASDCGEAAMDRLRHPFLVVPASADWRTSGHSRG